MVPADVVHRIVFSDPKLFAAWPANGGGWSFDGGKELLVGFISGSYRPQPNHDIDPPFLNRLARSVDGGDTWTVEECPTFLPPNAKRLQQPPKDPFTADTIVRIVGDGYQGSKEPKGAFIVSHDRGRSWSGLCPLAGFDAQPELRGWECSARTDVLREEDGGWLWMLSARRPGKAWSDRTFAARWRSGKGIEFVGWIVPPSDPFRGVMPSTVRCSPMVLVSAVRRRDPAKEHNWLDLYRSEDGGTTWRRVSSIADTGDRNGNPPALLRLADKRLCCVYGQRSRRQLLARVSHDDGRSWGPEWVLRNDHQSDAWGDADLGYPRLFQRPDGRLVAVYYWCTPERPHGHIAATRFSIP